MTRNADGTWTGLLMALVVVMFSFGGTELIGITAGETENPRTTIPEGHERHHLAYPRRSTSARSA